MSAIGGWICYEGRVPETTLLTDMSRAMLPRGKDQRGAYLREGGCLFHNRSLSDGESPDFRQPLTLCRGGWNYTVVLDGRAWGRGEWSGVDGDITSESDASLVLECYLAYGSSFWKHLEGSFALAIWDERRGELILGVDREGSRPLFYSRQGDALLFASEIKGLLRGMPSGAVVDRGYLRRHLLSPIGTVGAGEIYRDIRSLPAGHCAILSRMGLSFFQYGAPDALSAPVERTGEVYPLTAWCPEEAELRRSLTEALFSFDYPQFDCLMPALLRLMDTRRERRLWIGDEMLYAHIGYARERADRLGQRRGRVIRSVLPGSVALRERELKKMDRQMRELLDGMDLAIPDHLFGTDWREALEREKNTAKRIRMRGMLYQSILWNQHYSLVLA